MATMMTMVVIVLMGSWRCDDGDDDDADDYNGCDEDDYGDDAY